MGGESSIVDNFHEIIDVVRLSDRSHKMVKN